MLEIYLTTFYYISSETNDNKSLFWQYKLLPSPRTISSKGLLCFLTCSLIGIMLNAGDYTAPDDTDDTEEPNVHPGTFQDMVVGQWGVVKDLA